MLSPGANRRTPIGANMTPMIDVVFLLIIFFLVSSHLAKHENRPPLDLPTAGPQPDAGSSDERLSVNINADGSLLVGGTTVSQDHLSQRIDRHARRHGDDAALHIRTDRRVPYATIEPLLRDAARVGITQITFAVSEQP